MVGTSWADGQDGSLPPAKTGREVEGVSPEISKPDAPFAGYGMFHIVIIVQFWATLFSTSL